MSERGLNLENSVPVISFFYVFKPCSYRGSSPEGEICSPSQCCSQSSDRLTVSNKFDDILQNCLHVCISVYNSPNSKCEELVSNAFGVVSVRPGTYNLDVIVSKQ